MSSRTRSVAVAVSAMNGTSGNNFAQLGELAVFRPEIVAPFADAMRLVNGDAAARSSAANRRKKPESISRSGASVEQAEFAVVQTAQARPRFAGGERGIQKRRRNAAGLQRIHLVFHQRDQRRDDDREAVARSAGSWKQSDLPPPVGSSAKTSLPASESRMISSCNGRNEVKPKYCFSSGSRFVVPDFTAAKVGQAGWSSSFSLHRCRNGMD